MGFAFICIMPKLPWFYVILGEKKCPRRRLKESCPGNRNL